MNPTEEARLREVFADAAHGITPGPVPLTAVERAGRARRRRRTAGLTACCGLLVASLAVTAHRFVAPEQHRPVVTPASPTASPPPAPRRQRPAPTPPKVVAPGERVKAAPGVELWLTEEGKHWSTPDGGENFRSVTDGNLDTTRPGISHQSESDGRRTFHSGVYYGTKDAARVTLTDQTGRTTTATMVELPGKPGWGAWYASATADPAITLYDSAGNVLAGTGL
ncbi:hypothetical protein AMK26_06700 [Streptomyces sp. CB03234]|uniref:hypothetical protein n=1 Tax=Streptomyces sp. (strain CB03234) TaxID=1703937 RepID=UPI00093A9072|nr:hypothetical protein [Streptomyces sp. CB03234]OKK05806.1 hypothetical protein AMK26_06700 [Streptomyces sp. CB03234]